jgi:hypothetical protein
MTDDDENTAPRGLFYLLTPEGKQRAAADPQPEPSNVVYLDDYRKRLGE